MSKKTVKIIWYSILVIVYGIILYLFIRWLFYDFDLPVSPLTEIVFNQKINLIV